MSLPSNASCFITRARRSDVPADWKYWKSAARSKVHPLSITPDQGSPPEIALHFGDPCPTISRVKQPLALLLYEKLLPGSQLVHRLQDLNYRVQPVPAPGELMATAEREKPLVIFVDLEPNFDKICEAIVALRQNMATRHVPIIAFASNEGTPAHQAASRAGATLVVNDHAVLLHLNQFLERALEVD
jgi:CheY-like chemotaxis protein